MSDDKLTVGEQAPDVTLKDETGAEVQLSDYWRKQPLLLVYIRHFG